MFQRTRDYDAEEASRLARIIMQEGLFGQSCQFVELFYCLSDLAKANDRDSFKQVVDSVLEYAVRRNSQYPAPQVRLDVLDHLSGISAMADMGRIFIGLPVPIPEKPGKVLSLFYELYRSEAEELIKNYDSLPKGAVEV